MNMEMTLDARQIRILMQDSMELGVKKTLVELGLLTPYLSKQQAYKMYGRAQVDRWLKEKLIGKIKDGTNTSSMRLSRMELEMVAKTSNRMSWYTNYVREED